MTNASLKDQPSAYLINKPVNQAPGTKGPAMMAIQYMLSLMTIGTLYGVLATIMIVTA